MNQIFSYLPLIRVLQLLGINTFGVNKSYQLVENRGVKAYTWFQIGLSVLTLSSFYYEKEWYTRSSRGNIANTVDFLQLIGMKLAKLVILVESIYQHKMLVKYFSIISEIDETMEKLGINLNYRKLRKNILNVTIMSIIFYTGIHFILLFTILFGDPTMIGFWSSYFFPYLISSFRFVQIISLVFSIKIRIECLNEKLTFIKIDEEGSEKLQLNTVDTVYYRLYKTDMKIRPKIRFIKNFEQLVLYRKMYNKLFVLSTIINYSFGLSNLINIANGFVSITANSYFIFLCSQSSPFQKNDYIEVIGSAIWSLPHIVNIVALSAICHFTVFSSIKTALIMHKINYDPRNRQQTLFLEQFSLQLLHQKINFSAFGFFSLDFTLLYAIGAAITTYLVILIQFYVNE